ncbi:YIP1 family protein [Donghicola sp. XS_ASV15]|uniref:YIP1 family protein n=1 Tax=Donghicola sp. XS_ASV15 TaxID=3241295 RepID=UPI00351418D3
MTLNVSTIWQLILATLRDPDAVAESLLGMRLQPLAVWHIFGLTVIASVLMFFGTEVLLPSGLGTMVPPFMLTVVMGANLAVMSFAMLASGRALEGAARLDQVVLLMSWVQTMLIALQIPQSVLALAFPSIGPLFAFVVIGYALWLTTRFIKVAHGFETAGRAVATVVFGFVGITFGMVLLLALLGV